MKIYLDIDDTIISKIVEETPKGLVLNTYPAKHLKKFLKNALEKHNVYWLTTHCNGDSTIPVSYLSKYFDEELIDMIVKIKPTRWEIRKLDAINLEDDFIWFDDMLRVSEERDLKAAGKMDSFVLVNLVENEDFWLDL